MLILLLACTPTTSVPIAPTGPTGPRAPSAPAAPARIFGPAAFDPIATAPTAEVLERGRDVHMGTLTEGGVTRDLEFVRIEMPEGFGAIVDAAGKPTGRTCEGADFNAFFPGVMLTHFECGPGVMYRSELDADLHVVKTAPVDFSAFGGGFQHCAGSPTPWGTLLSSEEYEPDAHVVDRFLAAHPTPRAEDWPDLLRYHEYNATTGYSGPGPIPAYRIGWIPEVTPAGMVSMHYAMGRFSHELGVVLPDRRTVYLTDDAGFGGLYRFVADTAGDLSAGTLYAMKLGGADTHSLDREVRWIDLGHATDAEVRAALDSATPMRFDALFTRTDLPKDNVCPGESLRVENNGAPECLAVKPGMAALASRLETRRYAELLGATVELSKEEGLAYDTAHNMLYVAVTALKKGMVATEGARVDDLQLTPNRCGAVLRLELDANYAGTALHPLVMGVESVEAGVPTCEGMSNPDNIAMLEAADARLGGPAGQLLIGEDTDLRPNPRLWAVNLDHAVGSDATQPLSLVPILVGPLGAEVSGLHAWEVAGRRFIGVTLQHVGEPGELADMPSAYGLAARGSTFASWLGIIPL